VRPLPEPPRWFNGFIQASHTLRDDDFRVLANAFGAAMRADVGWELQNRHHPRHPRPYSRGDPPWLLSVLSLAFTRARRPRTEDETREGDRRQARQRRRTRLREPAMGHGRPAVDQLGAPAVRVLHPGPRADLPQVRRPQVRPGRGRARRQADPASARASKDDYLAKGVLFVPEQARFQRLLELPEGTDVGKARALYREWFVHFRFPGHEKVEFVDSALGRIPEGWKVLSIGEATENYDRKRKPLSSMQRAEMQGPYPYYGAAKVFDHIDDYLFDGRYLLAAEDGSVVTADRRPMLQIATGRFWVNNHAHVLTGKPPFSTDFIYLRLNELDITPYITGAAQPKVTQANLNRIPVLAPQATLLRMFDEAAGPILALIDSLGAQKGLLSKTRDLLLPRLISGEIDVDSLDLPETIA
jgi:hypothetical protein